MTFARYFPKTHPNVGVPTYFVEKIYKSLYVVKSIPAELVNDFNYLIMNDDNFLPKNHTIRKGNRWKIGDKFSPRVWSGKPYNSKQITIAPDIIITKIYDIRILVLDFGRLSLQCVITIDGKPFDRIEDLAMNDGLHIDDFLNWFLNKKSETFSGQIICWKDLNY